MEHNETQRTIDERNEEVFSLIRECSSWEELSTLQDSIEKRVLFLFHKKVREDLYFQK